MKLTKWAFAFVWAAFVVFAALLFQGCSGGGAASPDEEIAAVMADWGVLEMPEWTVHTVPRGELLQICHGTSRPEHNDVDACGRQGEWVTWVGDDLDPERRHQILLHELGHFLRGGGNVHLPCVPEFEHGADVMCPAGAVAGSVPTERDRAFVHITDSRI